MSTIYLQTRFFPALLLALLLSSCNKQPEYPAPRIEGSHAVIMINNLRPEVPAFYTYRHQGKNIHFFILKINDTVNAFLDACMTCYPHKMGYRYDDGSVICRYCNMRFSLFALEKGIGGCYPIKIDGNQEKDRYIIAVKTLEDAADKF